MKQRILIHFCLLLWLGAAGLTMTMCGDKPTESPVVDETPLEAESLLTPEEQRAYRIEAAVAAEKQITAENFETAFSKLKKEIEADH